MAKIVRFHQLGGPEVLKIEEVPRQEPKKGEVRLSVRAIGLNRSESMFMQNLKRNSCSPHGTGDGRNIQCGPHSLGIHEIPVQHVLYRGRR
jgi:NADPH:quinone reductase-like Zn-dependent oxidoreductase